MFSKPKFDGVAIILETFNFDQALCPADLLGEMAELLLKNLKWCAVAWSDRRHNLASVLIHKLLFTPWSGAGIQPQRTRMLRTSVTAFGPEQSLLESP